MTDATETPISEILAGLDVPGLDADVLVSDAMVLVKGVTATGEATLWARCSPGLSKDFIARIGLLRVALEVERGGLEDGEVE